MAGFVVSATPSWSFLILSNDSTFKLHTLYSFLSLMFLAISFSLSLVIKQSLWDGYIVLRLLFKWTGKCFKAAVLIWLNGSFVLWSCIIPPTWLKLLLNAVRATGIGLTLYLAVNEVNVLLWIGCLKWEAWIILSSLLNFGKVTCVLLNSLLLLMI